MPRSLPDLELSHGQVLWALNDGREPDQMLKDQVRYLRQLGIPERSTDAASGSGNRITYGFHDIVELGLALTGLKRRFKPKDIQAVLVGQRDDLRKVIDERWRELPEDVLTQAWVFDSRQPFTPDHEDLYLRLHDRRSEKWGQLDFVSFDEVTELRKLFEPVERMPDGAVLDLLPVTKLMLPWIARALEAPETRTGPR